MRIAFAAVVALLLGACNAFEQDGVSQCRKSIQDTLKAPASYKEADVQVTDINTKTPEDLRHLTQRWVTITYDAVNSYNAPIRDKRMCSFYLNDGKLGGEVPAPTYEPDNMM